MAKRKLKPLPGAPYVEPVKAMLGDKHLNPEEEVKRQREELLNIRHEKHSFPGQDQGLTDAGRSEGPKTPSGLIVARLLKLNPRILVKDGIPGNVALYAPKSEAEMARDGYDLTRPQWWCEHKYVTGLPVTALPEWGHLTTDTDGIAEREVRGWRSLLIALVKQGVITYPQAIEEFGEPVNDSRAYFWFKELGKYKTGEESWKIRTAAANL